MVFHGRKKICRDQAITCPPSTCVLHTVFIIGDSLHVPFERLLLSAAVKSCQQLSVYPTAVIEHVSQLTKTTRHSGQEIFRKKKKNTTSSTCINAREATSFLFAIINSMIKTYPIFSYLTILQDGQVAMRTKLWPVPLAKLRDQRQRRHYITAGR